MIYGIIFTNKTFLLNLLKKLVPKEINVQIFFKKIHPHFLKCLKYLRAFSSQGKKQNQNFKKDFRFSILDIFKNVHFSKPPRLFKFLKFSWDSWFLF